jgi:Big-like domain-containing protein
VNFKPPGIISWVVALAAAFLPAACGGGGSGPSGPQLLSIQVNPPSATLISGETQQFTAMGTFSDGKRDITSRVTWSVSPPAIASVDIAGMATATAFGNGSILASSGSVSGNAALTVRATARFDTTDPKMGPFPSDLFTTLDAAQITGLRVNLPKPDCTQRPSDCQDLDVINMLDGFNLQPRLAIPLDGTLDVNTATSANVFLVSLGAIPPGGGPAGPVIGINQVVWDPASEMLFVESDAFLDQHARYLLVATNGLRDGNGNSMRQSLAFQQFRDPALTPSDPQAQAYHTELVNALASSALANAGVAPDSIVAASVFVTQSVTAALEKMRDQIKAAPAPAAPNFVLGSMGERTVFPLSNVSSIVYNRQTSTAPGFVLLNHPSIDLLGYIPGAVGTIGFGKFQSPDYETPDGLFPAIPTGTGVPQVQSMNDIYFDVFLPASAKPTGGWPVAISMSEGSNHKEGLAFRTASILAEHGVASISINIVGNGGGPLGTMTLTVSGNPVTLPVGGRGIDANGDGLIDSDEGFSAKLGLSIIFTRDGLRQTVVDLMQLVRVIEGGVDVDGDGTSDLDPSKIYFLAKGMGSRIGTIFLGIEPDVHVGVPMIVGGFLVDDGRISLNTRSNTAFLLGVRTPSLLNGGVDGFNENIPLRYAGSVINNVPGAMDIQEYLDHARWVQETGDDVAYAPYLRKEPLPGVPAKSVLLPFAKGDMTYPNPGTTAMIRAGSLTDRTIYFRNDLEFAADPNFPKNPFDFPFAIDPDPDPNIAIVGAELGESVGKFFETDGVTVTDPDGAGPLFEVPIAGPLPEDLNYIP